MVYKYESYYVCTSVANNYIFSHYDILATVITSGVDYSHQNQKNDQKRVSELQVSRCGVAVSQMTQHSDQW